ncbi:hypothetical protein AURDEDRAFT_23058, partial [Auricularia subglabra TFB-10046 SS5]
VRTVSKLRNGGVIYEFHDKEAVDWIRAPGVRDTFIRLFDPSAILRDHAHPVLLKNVPIEFPIDSPDFLRAIEADNGLQAGCLIRAQWMKPKGRRRKGQNNAHLRVLVSSADAANSII